MRSLLRLVTACASQLVRVRLRLRLVALRNRSRFATGRVLRRVAFFALAAGGKVKCS